MKKAVILYDTIYGNTKKIAMQLIRGLEAGGIHVDSSSIQNFEIQEIGNYDVIGIGGPTHFHGASKNMRLFLSKIKKLHLENKKGFAFETRADFRLAGSAVKTIIKNMKKAKINIIHESITGIVSGKEGPLQESTSNNMEHIGLRISEKINNGYGHEIFKIKTTKFENLTLKNYLSKLKWLLLGGGPLFFFIRALYLASTGGDCFGTINPLFSWFLLISEIVFSGIAGSCGITGLILWINGEKQRIILKKSHLPKIVLFTGYASYSLHFIRVAIWISLCVI